MLELSPRCVHVETTLGWTHPHWRIHVSWNELGWVMTWSNWSIWAWQLTWILVKQSNGNLKATIAKTGNTSCWIFRVFLLDEFMSSVGTSLLLSHVIPEYWWILVVLELHWVEGWSSKMLGHWLLKPLLEVIKMEHNHGSLEIRFETDDVPFWRGCVIFSFHLTWVLFLREYILS